MGLGYCYERFEFNIKVLLNNKGEYSMEYYGIYSSTVS